MLGFQKLGQNLGPPWSSEPHRALGRTFLRGSELCRLMEATVLDRRLSGLGAHAAQHRAMPFPTINVAPAQGLGGIWV